VKISIDDDRWRKVRRSHSIVSCACNRLKSLEFPPRKVNFTVTLAVKKFCLIPIADDRCRKQYLLCSEFVQVVPSTPSPPGLPVGMDYSSFRPDCLSTGTLAQTLYRQTAVSDWKTPEAVRKAHAKASILKGGRVVFNIKANDFRLVALVQYIDGILMIRFFGSHEEYDDIDAETV
jgi:mRNA-degrading endonuclease HigB of HigAB toxin-antitoxin module